jgi:hypothetical protein
MQKPLTKSKQEPGQSCSPIVILRAPYRAAASSEERTLLSLAASGQRAIRQYCHFERTLRSEKSLTPRSPKDLLVTNRQQTTVFLERNLWSDENICAILVPEVATMPPSRNKHPQQIPTFNTLPHPCSFSFVFISCKHYQGRDTAPLLPCSLAPLLPCSSAPLLLSSLPLPPPGTITGKTRLSLCVAHRLPIAKFNKNIAPENQLPGVEELAASRSMLTVILR